VFDQINGLPVHALVVHAAVVFVPLLALGAIAYALVPRWRAKIGWAVIALAVIAPICTLVSRLSGEKLYDRLVAQGLKGKGKEMLDDHMGFGSLTFWFTLALGVVTLVMVLLTLRKSASLPRAAGLGLAVIMVALAAISGYYVFRTGDSGAHVVWGTY
jgi:fucose 4-O-acetylase-like acetyltransferase